LTTACLQAAGRRGVPGPSGRSRPALWCAGSGSEPLPGLPVPDRSTHDDGARRHRCIHPHGWFGAPGRGV